MRYPELPILPDHLTKIAVVERFAGQGGMQSGVGNRRAGELASLAQVETIVGLLGLEGRSVSLEEVEHTINSLENQEVDLGRYSDEVLGLYVTLQRFAGEPYSTGEVLRLSILSEVHHSLFEGVTELGDSGGMVRDRDLVVQAFGRDGVVVGDVFAAPDVSEIEGLVEGCFEGMALELESRRWHPLLLISWFAARLLSVQPFTAGSIRVVHVLCEMLSMAEGYGHMRLQSLARIMEMEAGSYFVALRKYVLSSGQGDEGLLDWHSFFLGCLAKQAACLRERLDRGWEMDMLPPLSEELVRIAEEREKVTVREACEVTGANRNTVKLHLRRLVDGGALVRRGTGRGTWYSLMRGGE